LRIIVLIAILVAGGPVLSWSSFAYAEGVWCLIYDQGQERCDFPAFDACRLELRGQFILQSKSTLPGQLAEAAEDDHK
jgi:hypothetical protein